MLLGAIIQHIHTNVLRELRLVAKRRGHLSGASPPFFHPAPHHLLPSPSRVVGIAHFRYGVITGGHASEMNQIRKSGTEEYRTVPTG